jgi:hypothetical protein
MGPKKHPEERRTHPENTERKHNGHHADGVGPRIDPTTFVPEQRSNQHDPVHPPAPVPRPAEKKKLSPTARSNR